MKLYMCQNNIWSIRSAAHGQMPDTLQCVSFHAFEFSRQTPLTAPAASCLASDRLGRAVAWRLLNASLFQGLYCPEGSVLPSTCHSNLPLQRCITWLEHFIRHTTLLQGIVVVVGFLFCVFTNSENTHTR